MSKKEEKEEKNQKPIDKTIKSEQDNQTGENNADGSKKML